MACFMSIMYSLMLCSDFILFKENFSDFGSSDIRIDSWAKSIDS